MELEILLSTMNIKNQKENIEMVRKMNIGEEIKTLTINQITKQGIQEFDVLNGVNRVISKKEKGLSRSRNLAIKKAVGTICIIADDDVTYQNDFEKIILKEYQKDQKADIICFFVESNNPKRKVKRMCTSKIGKIRAMRICSFQITLKREEIIKREIKFDENFGAGTYYDHGEETIFLRECMDKGLRVKFVNKKIANVDQNNTSWFHGYHKDYFIKQGGIFKRMSPKWYPILILQFAIRKHKLYKENLTVKQAVKYMKIGAKHFISILHTS